VISLAKITPSRQRFREAEVISKTLQSVFGTSLRAVFVVGSTAANVATQTSDLDLVVVSDKQFDADAINNAIKHTKFCPNFMVMTSSEFEGIQSHIWPPKTRPSENEGSTIKDINVALLKKVLADGAIPIFGKEYASTHKSSWAFPNLRTIRERYVLKRNSMPARVRFKHSKKGRARFLR